MKYSSLSKIIRDHIHGLFLLCLLVFFIFFPATSFANELKKVRVFYRPDGGVSITHFAADACQTGETETQCMDRISSNNAEYGLPYDDMTIDQLPKDRADRDKWTGKKGKGVWVDTTLISRNDKVAEYKAELEEELNRPEPNASRVLKLEHLIEKVNDLDHPILSKKDIDELEGRKRSMLAAVAETVGNLFSGIGESLKNGIIALQSLVTQRLSVGTSSAPTGITVFDTKTGAPFCVVVEDGALKNTPGECGASPSSNASSDGQIVENQTPTISVNGNNPATINVGETYADLGATITGPGSALNLGIRTLVDGVETQSVSLDTSVPGNHTITYQVTDQEGLTGEATRTVQVVESAQVTETIPGENTSSTGPAIPKATDPTSPSE
ncbi:MAG: hypothetical protein RIQ56_965 [Candidatus Parcubacteria bacterium]|jgi:hypothetical protein